MKKLITLTALLLLIGCGSTKKNKTKSVEQIETKTELLAESKAEAEIIRETNTISIDTSATDEIIIEPINPAIEFSVNGKTYKNARITTKKVKAGISVVSSELVAEKSLNESKTDIKADSKINKKSEEKVKNVKQFNFVPYVILLVAIGMFLIWWYFGIGRRKEGKDAK